MPIGADKNWIVFKSKSKFFRRFPPKHDKQPKICRPEENFANYFTNITYLSTISRSCGEVRVHHKNTS